MVTTSLFARLPSETTATARSVKNVVMVLGIVMPSAASYGMVEGSVCFVPDASLYQRTPRASVPRCFSLAAFQPASHSA